jgi:hypothetical protein
LQRDPEKACPALGAGWVTGFRLARERETFARRSCSNKSSGEQSLFVESQSEQSSDPRASANIHGKSVQEILQRILSGDQSRAMGAKASLPYSNPHGIPLAAYFPTPGILAASASENRDIK